MTRVFPAAVLAVLVCAACAPAMPAPGVPEAVQVPAPVDVAQPGDAEGRRDPSELPASAPVARTEAHARFRSVDTAIEAAIDGGVTPGAVVAIGGSDGVLYTRGYGTVDRALDAPRAGESTIYDLASLTKVVATTTAVMLLVDRGRMGLDDPLSLHLAAWPRGRWRDEVTIRRLLTHRAGLASWARFWHPSTGSLRGQHAVVEAIAALPPSYPPGERYTYSDLGFILLGAAVEQVTGMPLDVFLAREAWSALGMEDTGFNPLEWAPLERMAPTELDTVFRWTHVHGVVHDENAYAMGGVAGHAGLFSTAADLATYARELLRVLNHGVHGAFPVGPATAGRFTTRQPGIDRALGWDAAPGSGGIARALSPRAFGHTGFTGTSLWVDPDMDLFIVLLTNRVNPTREGSGIGELRRTVHELAARAAAEP